MRNPSLEEEFYVGVLYAESSLDEEFYVERKVPFHFARALCALFGERNDPLDHHPRNNACSQRQ